MTKVILIVLASAILFGCQGLSKKPNMEFNGYLEQPTEPLFIEINPTDKAQYIVTMDFKPKSLTYFLEEGVTQKENTLVKKSKITTGNFVATLTMNLLPNGIVSDFDINEQHIESTTKEPIDSDVARDILQSLLESSGILYSAERFPDYALRQSITSNFKSKCWQGEERQRKAVSKLISTNIKISETEIITTSESECAFIGTTYIKGRKSAVFKEKISTKTQIKGGSSTVTHRVDGWRAIDIEKGLILEGESLSSFRLNGKLVENLSGKEKLSLIHIH